MLMAVCGVVAFFVLAIKLYQLQIVKHDYYEQQAVEQQTRDSTVTAARGSIYDTNGKVLAMSASVDTVFISPYEMNLYKEDKDLIATNLARLQKATDMGAIEGFVFKPNQIGTISEALETYEYGIAHDLIAVPSGRSGGVVDDVVMDLSVGLQVAFQKNGAPRSGERIEKLNFLMRAADSIPDCSLADVASLVKF
jgi:cell division protein FtsI/penicillin-binding protein 2